MIKTYWMDSSLLPDLSEDAQAWEACLKRLPEKRAEKIRRIRHPDGRKQSLGAGLLLQEALGRLAPGAEITHLPYGKPVCQQVPFNLSHTKDRVILSIWEGAGQPFAEEDKNYLAGCDIEPVRPCRLPVARRFFTESEYQSLEAVKDPREQDELFCRYWTKKESVIKLTGLGMSLPLHLFDVQGRQVRVDREQILSWCSKVPENIPKEKRQEIEKAAGILLEKQLFLKEYRWKEYCVAVCCMVDCFWAEMLRWTVEVQL